MSTRNAPPVGAGFAVVSGLIARQQQRAEDASTATGDLGGPTNHDVCADDARSPVRRGVAVLPFDLAERYLAALEDAAATGDLVQAAAPTTH